MTSARSLLLPRRSPNRTAMSGRFFGILFAIMLLGSMMTPTFARAAVGVSPQSAVVICLEEGDCAPGHEEPADTQGAHHHHCSHAINWALETMTGRDSALSTKRVAAEHLSLASLNRAPPTQPPSA